jgi:D-3-phosphoglycerate dehydrogenase
MKTTIVSTKITNDFQRLVKDRFRKPLQATVANPSELAGHMEDTVVLIPEHTPVDITLLDRAPMLKLVQCGAGYDYIDLKAAAERGVFVANAAGVNKVAVAEHTFALILALAKRILPLHQSMREGGWKSTRGIALELSGKTLGVVGLGNIGAEVARRGVAFGMKVLAVKKRPAASRRLKTRLVDLNTLLSESDVISLNLALNDETYHMIGEREFRMMKRSAFLVNTSRGAVVDERALYEALQTRKIAGAGIDVFSEEPLSAESPIRKLDNVILTPHTAASTPESIEHRYQFFAKNARRVLRGLRPLNVVNDL